MQPSMLTLSEYRDRIHQANVAAGWWTNINTGAPLDRNFGEMLALVHSELSEGYHGYCFGLNDDHLPQYPMLQVEIADACIRVFDMLGGCFKDISDDIVIYPSDMWGRDRESAFAHLHWILSQALENFRKGHKVTAREMLYCFLEGCFTWASTIGFDLLKVIDAKCAYNATRADHKIENRLKDDGKKI